MKILYDFQAYFIQKYGGLSRYHTELIKFIDKLNLAEIRLPIINSNNIYRYEVKQFMPESNYADNLIQYLFKNKIKGGYRLALNNNKKNTKQLLRENKFDVFHPTYYDPYFIKHCKRPYVITVHDLIHERFSGENKQKNYLNNKFEVLSNASKIIAISETTKKDIIDFYSIDKNKIDVIYHGVDKSFLYNKDINVNCKFDFVLPQRYILYVGNRNGYKNFEFFIVTISSLLKEDNELYLICTGTEFDSREAGLIKKLGVKDKIINCFVDDSHLAELYNKAQLFVFPSIYEGFGMPILEAFNSKCPVLLSNTPCFIEIANDAADFFEIGNEKDLCLKIEKIIYSENEKEILREKGIKRLEKFSWVNTANQTIETYKSIFS